MNRVGKKKKKKSGFPGSRQSIQNYIPTSSMLKKDIIW